MIEKLAKKTLQSLKFDKTKSDSELNILSWNVNGICAKSKREKVFLHAENLLDNRLDILVLISTKLNRKLHRELKNERNGDFHFNSIDGARGILIWINNTRKPIKAKEIYRDNEGNILILNISYDNESFQLVAIYGPSEADRPMFFDSMFDQITNGANSKFLIVGDWNATQNFELDNYGYSEDRYPNSRIVINKVKKDWGLHDPVELFNISRPHTTYNNLSINGQKSRLDYYLISPTLISSTKQYNKGSTMEHNGRKLDHEPIHLKLDFSNFGTSRKTWRFPDKYLCNTDFRKLMRRSIRKVVLRYETNIFGTNFDVNGDDHYVNDFMNNQPSETLYERQFTLTFHELYEMTMNEIRVEAIAYTASQKNIERDELKKRLNLIVKESQKLQRNVRVRNVNGNEERHYNQIILSNIDRLQKD